MRKIELVGKLPFQPSEPIFTVTCSVVANVEIPAEAFGFTPPQ